MYDKIKNLGLELDADVRAKRFSVKRLKYAVSHLNGAQNSLGLLPKNDPAYESAADSVRYLKASAYRYANEFIDNAITDVAKLEQSLERHMYGSNFSNLEKRREVEERLHGSGKAQRIKELPYTLPFDVRTRRTLKTAVKQYSDTIQKLEDIPRIAGLNDPKNYDDPLVFGYSQENLRVERTRLDSIKGGLDRLKNAYESRNRKSDKKIIQELKDLDSSLRRVAKLFRLKKHGKK